MSRIILPRDFEGVLQDWFVDLPRKPLVVRGARQVGKSTTIRSWAASQGLSLVEVNLDRHGAALRPVFESKDVEYILQDISIRMKKDFADLEKTVLFLDEIQSCPAAFPALRYFFEEKPNLAVVCAGSLLEFALADHNFSMPVGRVEYRYLVPFTFKEFLQAMNERDLLNAIYSCLSHADLPMVPSAHQRLLVRLSEYIFLGGMPEPISLFAQGMSLRKARGAHFSILDTYRDDFLKYASRAQVARLQEIFSAFPLIVCKKFKYSEVSREIKSRDIKSALTLIVQAGLLIPVHHTGAHGIPLIASQNADISKLLCLDTGLFNAQFFGENEAIKSGEGMFSLWESGNLFERSWLRQVCEQLIGQSLVARGTGRTRTLPNYWLREGKSGNAEIDYLVAHGQSIVPVEVKAGSTGTLKSLHTFMGERDLPLAVRFNAALPSLQAVAVTATLSGSQQKRVRYHCLSLPIYMADWLDTALELESRLL